MRRRAFLATAGITLAAVGGGCLGTTPPDASAIIEIESVTVNDDPEDKAKGTVNGDRATVEGTFGADLSCVSIETETFAGSDDDVVIDLTTEATGDDCDGPAAVQYAGEITANFTINKFRLNHVHEKDERTTVFWYERGD